MIIAALALVAILVIAASIAAGTNHPKSDKVSATAADTSAFDTSAATEPPITDAPVTDPPTTEQPATTLPAIGTRSNPIPAGTEAPAGDWKITILGYERYQNVQAFNEFNDAPPAGSEYVRVKVNAVYAGEGTGSPISLQLNLVGPSGATFDSASVAGGSGGDPQSIDDQADTFKGGVVQGFVYYLVPSTVAAGKLLIFPPNVTYSDVPGGVGFFAVN